MEVRGSPENVRTNWSGRIDDGYLVPRPQATACGITQTAISKTAGRRNNPCERVIEHYPQNPAGQGTPGLPRYGILPSERGEENTHSTATQPCTREAIARRSDRRHSRCNLPPCNRTRRWHPIPSRNPAGHPCTRSQGRITVPAWFDQAARPQRQADVLRRPVLQQPAPCFGDGHGRTAGSRTARLVPFACRRIRIARHRRQHAYNATSVT